MRLAPWLDPWVWPGSNCSSRTVSTPRRASHQAVAEPMAPAPMMTTSVIEEPLRVKSNTLSVTAPTHAPTQFAPLVSLHDLDDCRRRLLAAPPRHMRPNRPLVARRLDVSSDQFSTVSPLT